MGKNFNKFDRILVLFLTLFGCESVGPRNSMDCVEGIISTRIYYRLAYESCYQESIWIEVLNRDGLGKDAEIFAPAPTGQPNSPILYRNVIEVPIPPEFLRNQSLEEVLGRKIFFTYRNPDIQEIASIRNEDCNEVYETFSVPVYWLTTYSFDKCPDSSVK